MRRDINTECAGRWAQILINVIGIPEQYFSGRHCDCIICGDEKKHARWEPKKEFWICTKCGTTQPAKIAMHWTGESFKNVVKIIRNERPDKMEPIKQTDDTAKNLARIEKIKKGLKPINGDCPASLYLAKRGITVLPEKDCYFHPGVEYWKDGIKAIYPAIVSVFRNLEGKGATFHITYLTPDGKKAEVESPKKILPVVFPLSGCAIQLFKPRSGVLAVAEGIENILAVFQDQGIQGWAAGNSGQLASLVLPNDVVELWIYADPDYAGMEAAFKLAARYSKLKVFVTWPDGLAGMVQWSSHKQDFLDWLIVQNHQKQSET